MQNNIPARVKEIIADKLSVDIDTVIMSETKIKDDLGADSIDVLELVMALEDEFRITVPDNLVEEVVTVQHVINLVTERAGGK